MNTVKLDTRELDRIVSKLGTNTDDAIRDIAFAVEGEAKMRAPVDTGAMANSIYTVTSKEDGYSAAAGAARGLNPDAETIQHPQPGPHAAHVGPAVEYAAYVELGTSRMSAQPFLTPAVESVSGKVNSGAYFDRLTK